MDVDGIQKSLFAALTIGALLVGCDPSFTRPKLETPDELAAVSILQPYADRQGLLLTTVSTPQPLEGDLTLVQNAAVRIEDVRLQNRPADSVGFPQFLPRDGNYRTDTLAVRPGSTYALGVNKGEYALSGTVAVPDTFAGWSEGRRLVWTSSEGATRYQVHVEDAADTPFEFRADYTVTNTTVHVGENNLVGGGDTPNGSYYVEITAQDPNLTAFMRDETDRAGVEGGYGLFGARLRIAGTVRLSAEPGGTARTGGPASGRERAPLRFERARAERHENRSGRGASGRAKW